MRGRVFAGIAVCVALVSAAGSANASTPSGRIVFVTNRAPTLLRVVRYSVTPSGHGRRLVSAESPGGIARSRDGRAELLVRDGALFLRNRATGGETRLTPPDVVPVAEAGVAFSPTGKQVAFTGTVRSFEFEPYHLYVVDADGSRLRDLAPGLEPSWSADGKLIAYGGHPAMNTSTTVDVIRPDGSGRHSLGKGGPLESGRRAVWSPAGHRLAFSVAWQGVRTLVLVDADGRHRRRVGRTGASNLVWSADGSLLAFNTGREAQLGVVRANGRAFRRLARPSRTLEVPMTWSPQVDRLVVARRYRTGTQLAVVRLADGRVLSTITHEPRWTQFSDVSWRGKRITYGAYLPTNDAEVAVARASDGGVRLLTHDAYNENDPAAAPGGARVVFARDDGNNFWLLTARMNGSGLRRLSPAGRRKDRAPAWSPDGKRIAFVSFARPGGLEVMDADGSNLRVVASSATGVRTSWSPDGKRLAFSAPVPGGNDIFTVGVDGTDLRQVTHLGTALAPRYSPDGSRILFNVQAADPGAQDLAVVETDGSGLRRVAHSTLIADGGDWSPDGTRIVFARGDTDHSWIVTASVDGGDERIVTNTRGRNMSPSWSP